MGEGYLTRTHVIAKSAYDAVVQIQCVGLFVVFSEPVKKLWLQISRAYLAALAAVDTGNRVFAKFCLGFFTLASY
jgi:hypothetical protein